MSINLIPRRRPIKIWWFSSNTRALASRLSFGVCSSASYILDVFVVFSKFFNLQTRRHFPYRYLYSCYLFSGCLEPFFANISDFQLSSWPHFCTIPFFTILWLFSPINVTIHFPFSLNAYNACNDLMQFTGKNQCIYMTIESTVIMISK